MKCVVQWDLYKARKLIKKHKISGLDENLESIRKLPLIGSDRDGDL